MVLNWYHTIENLRSADMRTMMRLIDYHTDTDAKTVKWIHLLFFSAKSNSYYNPTWDESINGPHKEGYYPAYNKYINTLNNKHAWEGVGREDWKNVLPFTYSFKQKYYLGGSVRKLKARFCDQFYHQIERVDLFEIFYPLINWTTVMLMLII